MGGLGATEDVGDMVGDAVSTNGRQTLRDSKLVVVETEEISAPVLDFSFQLISLSYPHPSATRKR